MSHLLNRNEIAMHPFVVAELALGSLRNRAKILTDFDLLPHCHVAERGEVRQMIEAHKLYSRGIGVIDVNLLASCLLTADTRLWTRDAALTKVAEELGILAVPSLSNYP